MSRIAGCKDFRPHLPQQTNPETTHANLLLKKQKPKVSRKKHALYAGNPSPPPHFANPTAQIRRKNSLPPKPVQPDRQNDKQKRQHASNYAMQYANTRHYNHHKTKTGHSFPNTPKTTFDAGKTT